jgi:hypothetical protein
MSTLHLDLESASVVSVSIDDSLDGSEMGSSVQAHEANEMDTTQKDQVKEVEDMAKIETKNLLAWKVVVSLTVVCTAIVVSAGTFIFLRDDEDSNFKESYYSFAATIGDAAEVHTHNLFSTMRSCSNSISGAAIAANSTFPFVTVPTFEILGELVRQQAGAEAIIFTPIVGVSELTQWQEYATANEGWYEESKRLVVASGEGTIVQSDFAPGSPLPIIYEAVRDENGNVLPGPPTNPPFYPIWQFSPPPFSPFLIKANLAAEFSPGLKAASDAREGIIGSTTFSYPDDYIKASKEDHIAFHAPFSTSEIEFANDRPHAFFFQPIFREIYDVTSDVVGTINALIPWDRYFANLLPEGVNGITCVASNTCGQSFTYFIDGNKVSYCAPFDHERSLFEDYWDSTNFIPIFPAGVLCWRGRPTRRTIRQHESRVPLLQVPAKRHGGCTRSLRVHICRLPYPGA